MLHSRIPNVCQTNARVRKCVCGTNNSNRTLLDNYAPFNPVMSIRNVTKWCLFWCHFGVIRNLFQECSKRWFQWRDVNRLTLHFTSKPDIVTNGLSKMCPRLKPQRHFEAACCNGIAISAVARVSCMSVCKMRPRLEPQHCARPCRRPPDKHSESSSKQLLQAPKG